MNSLPAVSIVIPTYNRAQLLSHTLKSVLTQAFQDFEIVIVDDGSTDDTEAVVTRHTDPRLSYIHQQNVGGCVARNRGRQRARAPYILFLDSDDVLLPGALSSLLDIAHAYPAAGVLGGGFRFVDSQGNVLAISEPWQSDEHLNLKRWLFSCPFIPSATLVRTEWFDRVKGFDPKQKAAQDWDLWLRLSAIGTPMVWVKHLICDYRLHYGSLTSDPEKQKRAALRLLDKFFQAETSADLLSFRNEAYVLVYLYAAAREYALGAYELAQDNTSWIAKTVPDWQTSGRLLEMLLRQSNNPIVTDSPSIYREKVLDNLPDHLKTNKVIKRARSRLAAGQLFTDFHSGDWAHIPSLWWQAVSNDLSWLGNAGFWSIGVQGLLGPEITRQIKKVVHR